MDTGWSQDTQGFFLFCFVLLCFLTFYFVLWYSQFIWTDAEAESPVLWPPDVKS